MVQSYIGKTGENQVTVSPRTPPSSTTPVSPVRPGAAPPGGSPARPTTTFI